MSNLYLDLHIHSPYSAGTSPAISLHAIAQQATILGIHIMGTGDCLHPEWFENIKHNTVYDKESKLLKLSAYPNVFFMLTTEVNCSWDKIKEAHILLVFPADSKIIARVTDMMSYHSNLSFDGRPTVVLSPQELWQKIKNISEHILFIPAHVLTPWYGILGARVGYDSVEEAFDGFHPDALETGLSANATMVGLVTSDYPLVSNSDAHSIRYVGREVTSIICNPDYYTITNAIKQGAITTLEYPPKMGKYYLTGCRNCEKTFDIEGLRGKCPYCGKKIFKGVWPRVKELADKRNRLVLCHQNSGDLLPDESVDKIIPIEHRARYGNHNDLPEIEPGFDGRFGRIKRIVETVEPKKRQLPLF